MRVFRDLGLVEQLGSGVPRILESYSKDCFTFSDNFLRMAFPAPEMDYSEDTEQPTEQVTEQVSEEVQRVVNTLEVEMKLKELMSALDLSHRKNFKENYLEPAMRAGFIEMTHPDSPNHPNQKYRLTKQGKEFKKMLES